MSNNQNVQQIRQDDARPSGAEIRKRVLGEPSVGRAAPGDPFLAPFFETAIEHVWGGLWNRPGLELKYRSKTSGSTALVTGGTSGIGRATATKLGQLDIHVLIVGRNLERGEKTISEIRSAGGKADFIQSDLQDESTAREDSP